MMKTPILGFWCWSLRLVSCFTINGAIACIGNQGLAQLTPDHTLGTESSVVTPNVNVNGLSADRIDGGAKRGINLFHSFTQFNVQAGGQVYFANPPGIENIFSRVTGSNPSQILGTLGVLGNANLFLLNPNGIIFGSNARLDVRGSFLASTATSLRLSDGTLFSTENPTAPPLLTINVPIGLQFGTQQPGAIVNAGQLSVPEGQNFSLLGGTVVSTGQLTAPGGKLTMATIPGGSEVQLSPSGVPLSISAIANLQPVAAHSPSLFQLLNDAAGVANLGVITDSGEVKLAGTELKVVDGDVVVRQLTSGQATLSATNNLTLLESQLHTTENLYLLAQNTVQVRDSLTQPFIAQAGGQLLIQGDSIDIFALNHPESGFLSGGDMVLRSPTPVRSDAHYTTGGSFQIELPNGSLGNAFSLSDPVIRASGDVSFGSYQGASLHIFAGGSVTIPGSVLIGAADPINGVIDNVTLSNGTTVSINGRTQPTLDVRAGTTAFGTPGITGLVPPLGIIIPPTPNASALATNANITIGSITNPGGLVLLTNQYQPNSSLPGGAINVTGKIITGSQTGNGGSVMIDSRSTLALQDTLDTSSSTGNGGDITLIAKGNINTANINSLGALGGNINLTSNGTIALNDSLILSASLIPSAPVPLKGGDINVKTGLLALTNGARIIDATFGAAQGGNLNVSANSIDLNGTQGSKTLLESLTTAIPQLSSFLATLTPNQLQTLERPGSPLASPGSSLLAITAVGTGTGGNVKIDAGQVSVRDGTEISAYSFGDGTGGNLTVKASNTVELIGTTLENIPGGFYTESYGAGKAGDISIDTMNLTIQGGSLVSSTIFSNSPAGNIKVNASDAIELSGTTPDGQYPSGIGSVTRSPGNAGNIMVNTGRLIVQNGAAIGTTSFDQGNGGNLTVNASHSIELSGVAAVNGIPSILSADTTSSGNAGRLEINTQQLSIQNGALVSASTSGSGQGGSLFVNASESVELRGKSADGIPSGLYVQGFASGNAGNLQVTTGQLSVQDGARITASTGTTADDLVRFKAGTYGFGAGLQLTFSNQATGNAGNLNVTAHSILLDHQGSITAKTASGEGGNINLQARDLLLMRHNSQISTDARSGTGNGGNIVINSPLIVAIPAENSDITANAIQGRGGNIDITTQGIYGLQFRPHQTPLSDITASSDVTKLQGNVQINTLGIDPTKEVATLPNQVVNVSRLVGQGCSVGARQNNSKFVMTGRGGVPSNPNETLRNRRVLVDLGNNIETQNSSLQSVGKSNSSLSSTQGDHQSMTPTPPSSRIVEAQGWIVGSKGEVILTAKPPIVTSHSLWQKTSNCQMANE